MRKITTIVLLVFTVAVSLGAIAGCSGNSSTTMKNKSASSWVESTPIDSTQPALTQASTPEGQALIDLPNASTGQEAAQTILDLVKAHQYDEAQKYFMDPEELNTVVKTLGDSCDAHLGQAGYADSHAGGVDVFLDKDRTTPVMVFFLWRVQFDPEKWKVKKVTVL